MRNAGLEEAQPGIKIARININNLRYAEDITLMAETEELWTEVHDIVQEAVIKTISKKKKCKKAKWWSEEAQENFF